MFQRHRRKHHNKSIYALSFLVGKDREPQSINAKLFLPIIPSGIVAYALTLLWDNLCRNSCIQLLIPHLPVRNATKNVSWESFMVG